MKKYLFHVIKHPDYPGIITILDNEIRLNDCLSKLVFSSHFKGKRILVDLALKSGPDEYRFVTFDVNKDGKIVPGSNRYATVPQDLKDAANRILRQQNNIVKNSFLTDTQKESILSC